MTTANYGQRDASTAIDDLRGRMSMSPTGRQLASDGNLIAPLFDGDPSLNTANIPPQVTFGFWIDGTSLWLSAFTRETGWTSVELTP